MYKFYKLNMNINYLFIYETKILSLKVLCLCCALWINSNLRQTKSITYFNDCILRVHLCECNQIIITIMYKTIL